MVGKLSETLAEQMTRTEMKFIVGENSFGTVLAQGYTGNFSDIEMCLQKSGGKPKICELSDFITKGLSKGKPEYIVTFKNEPNLILVIECKSATKKHHSENFNHPKDYAVDGVLYYAKYLKDKYNVIAIGISGSSGKKDEYRVSSYFWGKNLDKPIEYENQQDFFLEPENYLRLYRGEKIQKTYSLDEIKETAIKLHDSFRKNSVENATKPIFIAALLIALSDSDFEDNFHKLNSFDLLCSTIETSIKKVLKRAEVNSDKIDMIIHCFNVVTGISTFKNTPLGEDNSLLWYLRQLAQKIIPMMNYAETTLDALGVFYHEFIKYSGSDGKDLGIVLTPQHLTEFMCELSGVNKNSKVVDICCGTGSFLVTAMGIMHQNACIEEWERIRKENLYGVELSPNHHLLALTNMIIRKDGKSNIYAESCFNKDIADTLKKANINIGLINPPYSLKNGHCELEFVEQMLNILQPSGIGVAVVPMSCAIGTKFKNIRKRLFAHHTLKAVFSMPDEIFSGQKVSTNVCVMLWEAHKKHDINKNTFFGYYKDDGFVKAKKMGRIDKFNKWTNIKKEWINLYEDKIIKPGYSCLKKVKDTDEWLCEAYMDTDFSNICEEDFQKSINSYLAYLINTEHDLYAAYNNIKLKKQKLSLNDVPWQRYNLVGVFEKRQRGKRLKSEDRESGNIRYFSASECNNGMTDCISNPLFKVRDALIYTTFGDAFFIPGEFTASDEVTIFEDSHLNKYNGLFLATVMRRNKYKYRFGRKAFYNKIQGDTICLPKGKNNEPDWVFMENYIKSLPYSDLI